MTMRKLFYLLFALPLVFAACEPEPAPTPEKEKEAVLNLTSEETMNFDAEGGEGVITYSAVLREVTRDVETPKISVSCEADWIELKTPSYTEVKFNVAANDGEARDTKVVVTFADTNFEVTVKQAAAANTVMDVELAAAARIPSSEADLADNYFALLFADDAENIELGIVLVGEEGLSILGSGNFKSADETLLIDECQVFVWDPAAEYTFVEGEVDVVFYADNASEDNPDAGTYEFDITLEDEDGGLYHFTYEGVVVDMIPVEKPGAEDFTPIMVGAYRSDNWDIGNFELDLYINDAYYHSLDMYDNVNPNNNYLSAGHYSMEDGSIGYWSNMIHDLTTGEGAYVEAAEIDLTHNEDGTSTIKGYFESEYGVRLNINWTGTIDGFDFTGGTPEPPTPGETEEYTMPYLGGEYYGTDYSDAYNYYVVISDAEATGNANVEGAKYYYFDLYSATDNGLVIPNGVYTYDPTDSCAAGTFSSYYSYGFIGDGNSGAAEWFLYAEGSKVTITDGKIVADLILADGRHHVVTYEGDSHLSIQTVATISTAPLRAIQM